MDFTLHTVKINIPTERIIAKMYILLLSVITSSLDIVLKLVTGNLLTGQGCDVLSTCYEE